MPDPSLETLLAMRGAAFDGCGVHLDAARRRAALTRRIAASFEAFESLRDMLVRRHCYARGGTETSVLLDALAESDLVIQSTPGSFRLTTPEAQRYVRGGWLEEYVGLAAEAAGADEVRIGQTIKWKAGGYSGVNEIDALARFGPRVLFMSAKALRSHLDGSAGHRDKLMDALQEADNIVDHFGDDQSSVFLFVTTDLYDERQRKPRYEQLYGKAAALDVELVTLDNMAWEPLISRLARTGR